MKKRTLRIALFTVIFSGILVSLFVYNWVEYQKILEKYESCEETWCVRVYGEVTQESFIGYSNFIDDSIPRIENVSYFWKNMYNTTRTFNISGVRVWDVLQSMKQLLQNPQYFRFEATDGYLTYLLPFRLLEEHPDDFIIVTHIDGKIIPNRTNGGDGPLMSAVLMEGIENDPEVISLFQENLSPGFNHVHNSKFSVKYFNALYLE
ncbi:hypothetical protein NEF87_005003 [Candidatus Lokiarchaeum ossiferum]|uniref:Uncharacterized protein n=1 Tax=Candidatus Lokiarchaeum ossiferum TaxID=2951803 RepID=A0ABY6HYU9_9ARCH|nr:hypothetical protein NEF87_005003 [Candidatus Lokiarchaeum sp. B-35]